MERAVHNLEGYIKELSQPSFLKFLTKPKPRITQCKQFVSQICRGLKYLHNLEIAHRDLKPQNLLVFMVIGKIENFSLKILE